MAIFWSCLLVGSSFWLCNSCSIKGLLVLFPTTFDPKPMKQTKKPNHWSDKVEGLSWKKLSWFANKKENKTIPFLINSHLSVGGIHILYKNGSSFRHHFLVHYVIPFNILWYDLFCPELRNANIFQIAWATCVQWREINLLGCKK